MVAFCFREEGHRLFVAASCRDFFVMLVSGDERIIGAPAARPEQPTAAVKPHTLPAPLAPTYQAQVRTNQLTPLALFRWRGAGGTDGFEFARQREFGEPSERREKGRGIGQPIRPAPPSSDAELAGIYRDRQV